MLADIIRRNREEYLHQVRGELAAPWDYVVLTAANAAQARGYELELARCLRAGWLPAGVEYLVVSDPDQGHLGSGGATAYGLRMVAARWGLAYGLLKDHSSAMTTGTGYLVNEVKPETALRQGGKNDSLFPRVLVINSGGDSKRIPHCAALGKVWAGLPFPLFPGGPDSTVFAELLVSVCRLAWPLGGGTLVLSGDVLLAFDSEQVMLGPGVTGLACLVPADLAARHGVYVSSPYGGQVQDYLQKPSYEEMRAAGALVGEQALLDTGLLAFDAEATKRIASLAGVKWTEEDIYFGAGPVVLPGYEQAQIDLYTDICLSLAGHPRSAADSMHTAVEEAVDEALVGLKFSVAVPTQARFVHLGTTAEWLNFCCGQAPEAQWYGIQVPRIYERCNQIGSLDTSVPTAIEYSRLLRLEAGERCLLSNVEGEENLVLPSGTVLSMIPLRLEQVGKQPWVALVYGVEDDPKLPVASGGVTYLGRPLADWLDDKKVSAADLWPNTSPSSRTLWNAKLFVPGDRATTLRWAMWLLDKDTSENSAEWRKQPRLSLEESVGLVAPERLHEHRTKLSGVWLGSKLIEAVKNEECAETLLGVAGSALEVAEAAAEILRYLERESDSFRRARAYLVISDLLGNEKLQQVMGEDPVRAEVPLVSNVLLRHTQRRFGTVFEAAGWLEEEAFREISAAVAAGVPGLGRAGTPRLAPGMSATVQAPARLDFGGGWSDTPPFSLERGGAVLNAAVRLDGRLPILARSEVLEKPVLELISEDADTRQVIVEATDLLTYGPGDPLALHKAALIISGLAGFGPGGNLSEFLLGSGGGLRLLTRIDLPQGSGLGTSSIAAAALLRSLDLLQEREFCCEDLNGRVLYVEQMITTGGGWQDQLGAMIPGVKLLETEPGLAQWPRITPVAMSAVTAEELQRRLLVCFVGERRVAKNILHQIMRRWLARAPEVVRVLSEIKDLARAMKEALEAGDLDEFGRLMAHHWELNKLMDRQTTTSHVDALFAALGDLAVGAKLAGAGGGGFMEIVAKDEQAARRIQELLTPLLADKGGRFYQVAIAEVGLVEGVSTDHGHGSLQSRDSV